MQWWVVVWLTVPWGVFLYDVCKCVKAFLHEGALLISKAECLHLAGNPPQLPLLALEKDSHCEVHKQLLLYLPYPGEREEGKDGKWGKEGKEWRGMRGGEGGKEGKEVRGRRGEGRGKGRRGKGEEGKDKRRERRRGRRWRFLSFSYVFTQKGHPVLNACQHQR